MGFVGFLLLMVASLLGTTLANKATLGWYDQWNSSYSYGGWGHHPRYNDTQVPNRINVGGPNNWQFGFDYMTWARDSGPFYVNDTLVFKYDPPSDTNTHPHSVYVFPNVWSFIRCDLKKAKMIANSSDGAGDGFEFPLTKWRPYYFACGASGGFHCNTGKMKFFVIPFPRRWRHY